MPKYQEDLLKIYCDYLAVEKGLSANSLSSYALDIKKLFDFLDRSKKSLLKLKETDLVEFIHLQAQSGLSPRSLARLVSSLKSFSGFSFWKSYQEESGRETDLSLAVADPAQSALGGRGGSLLESLI